MSDDLTAVRTTIGLVVENIDALIDCMKAENARLLALLDTHPWQQGWQPVTEDEVRHAVDGMADLRGTVEPVQVTYTREAVKEWVTHADLHGYVAAATSALRDELMKEMSSRYQDLENRMILDSMRRYREHLKLYHDHLVYVTTSAQDDDDAE